MPDDPRPLYPNQVQYDEHDNSSAPNTKRVSLYGWDADNLRKTRLAVKEDGSLAVGGFDLPQFDYIGATYPNATTEVYAYKTGGSGGSTVATLTVVYQDATKALITSVTKS